MFFVSSRIFRWLLPLLSVGVVTGIGLLAWPDPPLSPIECQLLGHWRDEGVFEVEGYTFTEDRRFVRDEIAARWVAGEGHWSAAKGKLELHYEHEPPRLGMSWVAVTTRLRRFLAPDRSVLEVQFDGPNRMIWRDPGHDPDIGLPGRRLVRDLRRAEQEARSSSTHDLRRGRN